MPTLVVLPVKLVGKVIDQGSHLLLETIFRLFRSVLLVFGGLADRPLKRAAEAIGRPGGNAQVLQ